MSIDTVTELQHAVEDAAAHLYVWALKDIPQDLRDALKAAAARETSVPGIRVRHDPSRTSRSQTPTATSSARTPASPLRVRVGEHFRCIRAHLRRAPRRHRTRDDRAPARSNAAHRSRARTPGPNIGHRLPTALGVREGLGRLDVKCVPKGSGSENMSFLRMCVPADGVRA